MTIYKNTCKHCNGEIPEKTKSGKPRQFCDKSCSRKHYIQNNREKVIEGNKKGYQTLRENNPEGYANRVNASKAWHKSEEGKRHVEERIRNGHYKRMSIKGNNTRKERGNSPEQIAKWKETYAKNGYMVGDRPEEWKVYSRACRRLTAKIYGRAGDGLVWDHIVPLKYCFENDITVNQACSPENIRCISSKENSEKWMHLTEESNKVLRLWSEAYN